MSVKAGEHWEKIYGPWMLYVNSNAAPDALWADAKKQVATLRSAWPFAWMRHPLYPLENGRGTVTGQLRLSDPQMPDASAAGAWVGLAMPQPDWQKQANGHQFWARADKDGRFTIPHVLPGDYTLYAFTSGVMDEFRRDGVKVSAGKRVELGALDWQPVRHGRQLWQIGVPDRTAAIQFAVDMARTGDVVASFGKGHERSMCYGEIEHPWSDRTPC